MANVILPLSFLCKLLIFATLQTTVTSVVPNEETLRIEPQVAVLCDVVEQNEGYEYSCQYQYLGKNGHWANNHTVTTHRHNDGTQEAQYTGIEPFDYILEYCKKAYPENQITNIVKTSHFVEVNGWCYNKDGCNRVEWLKPYRCLEGPFQSDALLVPDQCIFDHIHNQSHCWLFELWNGTALQSCQERGMTLHSFAMLLPCGLSLFSGVEFVCCPYNNPIFVPPSTTAGSFLDEVVGTGKTTTVTTREEHKAPESPLDIFKPDGAVDVDKILGNVVVELENTPHSKWNNFWNKEPKELRDLAIQFYVKSTNGDCRNAKEVKTQFSALVEEEQLARKAKAHEAEAQRAQAISTRLAQHKKQALNCYTHALNHHPPSPPKVQRCLRKLLRALYVDSRQATIRYHQLEQDRRGRWIRFEVLKVEKCAAIERIMEAEQLMNQSLNMLAPAVYSEVRIMMSDYLAVMKSKDSLPPIGDHQEISELFNATCKQNQDKLPPLSLDDKLGDTVSDKAVVTEIAETSVEVKKEEAEVTETEPEYVAPASLFNNVLGDQIEASITTTTQAIAVIGNLEDVDEDDKEAFTQSVDQEEDFIQPLVSKSVSQSFVHQEPLYSVKYELLSTNAKYFDVAFVGFVLVFMSFCAILVIKQRKRVVAPRKRGFAQVDQEVVETHITNMQINGYENPTYKYFDANAVDCRMA